MHRRWPRKWTQSEPKCSQSDFKCTLKYTLQFTQSSPQVHPKWPWSDIQVTFKISQPTPVLKAPLWALPRACSLLASSRCRWDLSRWGRRRGSGTWAGGWGRASGRPRWGTASRRGWRGRGAGWGWPGAGSGRASGARWDGGSRRVRAPSTFMTRKWHQSDQRLSPSDFQ